MRKERTMDIVVRIKGFVAVAECRGFTRAAAKMGKSKALLSKYVSELETEVGATLLDRSTRKVTLTDAGRSYLAKAKSILAHIASLQDSVSNPEGVAEQPLARDTPTLGKRSAALEVLSASERIGYLKGVVITALMSHGQTGEVRLLHRAAQAMRELSEIAERPGAKADEDQKALPLS